MNVLRSATFLWKYDWDFKKTGFSEFQIQQFLSDPKPTECKSDPKRICTGSLQISRLRLWNSKLLIHVISFNDLVLWVWTKSTVNRSILHITQNIQRPMLPAWLHLQPSLCSRDNLLELISGIDGYRSKERSMSFLYPEIKYPKASRAKGKLMLVFYAISEKIRMCSGSN